MTNSEYTDFVVNRMSQASMESFERKFITAGLGLAGEAGEVADIAKKCLLQGLAFDEVTRNKLLLELGDVFFYLTFTASQVLGVTLEEVLDANVKKLNERYKGGKFSQEEFMAKEKLK